MQAKVIGAAFQQGRRHRPADSLADQWQVAVIQLVLQRLGAGRNDGLAAANERRQQVRKGLARAGTRLDDELGVSVERVRHRLCHPRLSGARLKSGQQGLQGAVRAEEFCEILHKSGTIPRHRCVASVLN